MVQVEFVPNTQPTQSNQWGGAKLATYSIRFGGELSNPQPTLKGIKLVDLGKDSSGGWFSMKSKFAEKDGGAARSCQIWRRFCWIRRDFNQIWRRTRMIDEYLSDLVYLHANLVVLVVKIC